MNESDIQSSILRWLKDNDILHWRVPLGGVRHAGAGTKKNPMTGHPDIAGILPNTCGRYFAIEVKKPKGKRSPKQDEWYEKLNQAGSLVFVATSVQDVSDELSAFL